jgi:copper resistance protein C
VLVPRSVRATVAAVLVSAVLAAAEVVLAAVPASAHNRLISSDPAADATVTSPQSITLVFDDEVLPVGAAVQVTGPAGDVELEAPAVDGARIVQALPAGLPAGGYTVVWRVASGDGHPIDGTFAFTAAGLPTSTSTPSATANASATEPSSEAASEAARESADGSGPALLGWAALGGAVVVGAWWLAGRLRRRKEAESRR